MEQKLPRSDNTQAINNSAFLPLTGFIRLPAVLAVIPVSKSTWWEGVKSGRFPKSVKLSERITAWRAEDIRALIAEFQSRNA